MSVASRPVTTGKTRTCPHCKATILESLSICPGCMHHLRFDSEAAKRQVAAAPALRVEGIIRHPPLDQPQEYFVIIAIRNDRGEEVTRQVVGVGALQPTEKRTFSLSVEVLPPQAPPAPKPGSTVKQASGTPSAVAASPSTTGSYPGLPAASQPGPSASGNAPTTPSAGAAPAAAASTAAAAPGFAAGSPPPASPITGGAPTAVPPAGGAPKAGSPSSPAAGSPAALPSNQGASAPAPATSGAPKATYPGGLKPPTPGAPKPPMPGGFKKY